MAGNTATAYWLADSTKAHTAFTNLKTTECGPASGAL